MDANCPSERVTFLLQTNKSCTNSARKVMTTTLSSGAGIGIVVLGRINGYFGGIVRVDYQDHSRRRSRREAQGSARRPFGEDDHRSSPAGGERQSRNSHGA